MLTTAQLQTIKTAVQADPTASAYLAAGNINELTAWLNADSGQQCWTHNYSRAAMAKACVAGSADIDNLEAGKRDALLWLIQQDVDARDANVRQAFIDLTANRTGGFVATALRNALSAGAKRAMSRVEQMFATGPTAGAYISAIAGPVTEWEVSMLPSV